MGEESEKLQAGEQGRNPLCALIRGWSECPDSRDKFTSEPEIRLDK